MKVLIFVLVFFIELLCMGPSFVCAQDNASSGVIVIGPTDKSTALVTPEETKVPAVDATKVTQQGDTSNVKIPGATLNASFRINYEIKGDKIGDTQVSEKVSLPSEAMITSVDPGMGRAFIIVRVDEEGKETLALNISPEHAIGQKLPKGIYKVYPQDPDGTFKRDKLTARVQVGLVGNEVMDPRARGELFKTEKEQ